MRIETFSLRELEEKMILIQGDSKSKGPEEWDMYLACPMNSSPWSWCGAQTGEDRVQATPMKGFQQGSDGMTSDSYFKKLTTVREDQVKWKEGDYLEGSRTHEQNDGLDKGGGHGCGENYINSR